MDWRVWHKELMLDFLLYLNNVSNKFVLKGGTSLMFCYNLDRFSEDIDLDGFDNNFFDYIDRFIADYNDKNNNNLSYRKAKDIDTVKRVMLHYGNIKPLKIEVSYREKNYNESRYVVINNILVYNILNIMMLKLNAFMQRDKVRDMFDICFIYLNYKCYIDNNILLMLHNAIAFKGLDYFEYIVKVQKDELIDENVLLERFMTMYYDLGLT